MTVGIAALSIHDRGLLGIEIGSPPEEVNGVQLRAKHPARDGPGRRRALSRIERVGHAPSPSLGCVAPPGGIRPSGRLSRLARGRPSAAGTPLVSCAAREYVVLASSLPDTDFRNLLVTCDGSAGRIVLNRPEKRNALSLELMEEVI